MITDHKFFAKIIKNYFKNSTFNNSNNHNYYLTPFDTTPGLVKLHTLQKKKISYMAKYSSLIKNFTAASRLSNFELINKNNINDYNTIVLTWGRCNNFSDNGDYFDSCFNESSKNYKKILWFVVSLDNKVPKKINTNIVLLKNKNPELINFKHLIKLIIKKILTFFYKKNLNQFSFLEQFSIIVWENINNFVDVTKLKKIITPYEGQPFQNYINYKLKLNNKNINTIGYVHATQGFPIHLFRRDGAPNKLYVHGSDQKHHLINFLGWNKDQVQLISSLKFRKKDKKKISKYNFPTLCYS